MTNPADASSIYLSNGHTLSYAALDEMLEQQTLREVAQGLGITSAELMQVLKARPRS